MDLQFAIFSYFSPEKIVPSNGQQAKAFLWTLRHIILSVHTQPKIVVLQNQTQEAKLWTCQPEYKISTYQSEQALDWWHGLP